MKTNRLPKVSVVVLNYNGKKDTLACLQSLFYLNRKGFRLSIILIDNNSSELIEPELSNLISVLSEDKKTKDIDFKLIVNADNLGYAQGNNIGILEAFKNHSDYVFILNNDTVVDNDVINNLLKTVNKYKWGIVGPKIYFYPGNEFHFDMYESKDRGKVIWYAGGIIDWNNVLLSHRGVDLVDRGQFNRHLETEFISGCAMFMSIKVLKNIGLFNKDYFLYLEDADLCFRARKAKYKLGFSPKAVVWHKNAMSSNRPGSDIHVYYQTRNRLLFGLQYAKLRTKLALIKESIKKLFLNNIQRKAVLDYYFRRLGKGSL